MEGKVLSPQNHEINLNEVNSSVGKDVCLSKSQLKKIRRHEAIIEWKRKNRQAERDRKKSRVRVVENGESKKERSQKIKQRLLNVLCPNEETVCLHVCIDLQFEPTMSKKELVNLALQLCRTYGHNKSAESPARITLSNFKESGMTHEVCKEKNDGFDNYIWNRSSKSVTELFPPDKIIYLSPDSKNVLQNIDHDKVYVIGGLVDSCVKKNMSLDYSNGNCLNSARLPIAENCEKLYNGTYKQILTINQVFEILLKYYESKNWPVAINAALPKRVGLVGRDVDAVRDE